MTYNFKLIESNGEETSYCSGNVIADYSNCAARYCRIVYETLQEDARTYGAGEERPPLVLPVRMVATMEGEAIEITPYNVDSPELLAKVRKVMVEQYDIIKSN